jgi:cation transport protein ChaC
MSVSEDERALIESRRHNPEPGKDFFVFAYGSLMWRPDFPFAEITPATLYGYHRPSASPHALPRHLEHPGLVLGPTAAACVGRLSLAADAADVAEYLHQRELITGCYEPKQVTCICRTSGGRHHLHPPIGRITSMP